MSNFFRGQRRETMKTSLTTSRHYISSRVTLNFVRYCAQEPYYFDSRQRPNRSVTRGQRRTPLEHGISGRINLNYLILKMYRCCKASSRSSLLEVKGHSRSPKLKLLQKTLHLKINNVKGSHE